MVGALIIGTSAPLAKVAAVPPTVSAFYRLAIGGIVLLGICWWRGLALWRRPRDILWMSIPALLFALDMYVWHRSIHYVGPGLATILANCQVFLVALLGMLLYRERPGWAFLMGVFFAFGGIALLIGVDWSALPAQYRTGVWLGLATAGFYAGYILTMQHSQRATGAVSAVATLALVSLLCAVMLAGFVVMEDHSFTIPDLKTGGVLVIYGVFCQVVGWLLITRAMPVLPAFVIGLLLLLQPASSFLWDVIFFARPTGLGDAFGVALVLAGIYLASARVRA